MSDLSRQAVQRLSDEWHRHIDKLNGHVPEDEIVFARELCRPTNFGYGGGRIRPIRNLAQFDMFALLGQTQFALLISKLDPDVPLEDYC